MQVTQPSWAGCRTIHRTVLDVRAVVGEPELLHLFLLCGWYHEISFVARATRVAPQPGAPRFADIAAR